MSLPSEDTRSQPARGEITRLLGEASAGDRTALDRLMPLVYDELRVLARNRLRSEAAGHTLSPTALVHEAYLQLVEQERVEWRSRSHFFAVAAQAMRRILINYAKMKKRQKRGGGAAHVALDDVDALVAHALPFTDDQATELIALDEALDQLRQFNSEGAAIVEYRFFGGMEYRDISEVLGVSEVTARRRWSAARAWLRAALNADLLTETA